MAQVDTVSATTVALQKAQMNSAPSNDASRKRKAIVMPSLPVASYGAAPVTKRKKHAQGGRISLRVDRVLIVLGCAIFWALLFLIFR
jgi:hypothetical protein